MASALDLNVLVCFRFHLFLLVGNNFSLIISFLVHKIGNVTDIGFLLALEFYDTMLPSSKYQKGKIMLVTEEGFSSSSLFFHLLETMDKNILRRFL